MKKNFIVFIGIFITLIIAFTACTKNNNEAELAKCNTSAQAISDAYRRYSNYPNNKSACENYIKTVQDFAKTCDWPGKAGILETIKDIDCRQLLNCENAILDIAAATVKYNQNPDNLGACLSYKNLLQNLVTNCEWPNKSDIIATLANINCEELVDCTTAAQAVTAAQEVYNNNPSNKDACLNYKNTIEELINKCDWSGEVEAEEALKNLNCD